MTKKETKTGRQRSYSETQLHAALDAVLADGEEPTEAAVRTRLVDMFDISPSINAPVLAKAIKEAIDDRARAAESALVELVSEPVLKIIEAHLNDARRTLLIIAGKIEERAQGRVDDAREDAGGLLVALREKDRAHAGAEADWAAREAELMEADAEKDRQIEDLKAERAASRAEHDHAAKLEKILADFVAKARNDASDGAAVK